MTDFTRYFAPGVKNTLFLKNGVNFYNRGPWRQVFDDTEIDRWYVGDFTAAQYIISVEYNSQKKETMSVLVVARPDQASYSISGRASIDDPLITISATVNDSYLSLKLSPIIPEYSGVRVIYFAQYFATLTDLERPIPLSYQVPDDGLGTGGSSGGVIPNPGSPSGNANLSAIDQTLTPTVDGVYDVGISLRRFRDLYLKNTINLDGAVISKNQNGGIELPIGSTVDGAGLVSFGTISVAGEPDVESITLNDSLTLIAGSGMTISSDPSNRTITLSSSGGGGGSGTTSANAFGIISVAGQSTIRADSAADTLTFVAGAGIAITTNATSDRITITNTGSSSGGGTSGIASEVIVSEVLEGVYPMVITEGTDPLSGQSLYASSGVTLEVATSVLNVTATTARWADLAEKYLADAAYEPGTVLEFGGDKEVTIAEDGSKRIAGVVSTDPAFIMNNDLKGETVIRLALQGRVPCKVRGKIRKGDMLISGGNGYARPANDPALGTVIGKALENFDGGEGVIEVVVGRL